MLASHLWFGGAEANFVQDNKGRRKYFFSDPACHAYFCMKWVFMEATDKKRDHPPYYIISIMWCGTFGKRF